MLLFQKRFHAGLVNGDVTVTFRRWDKPHVRVGGRYRCHPIGVLEVDRVERVRVKDIALSDVKASGFETREDLIEYIRTARKDDSLDESTELFRVELHHGGDGDRVELALETELSDEDVLAIAKKLARFDTGSAGEWTKKTFAIIEKHPRIAASQLALKLGRETLPFKVDVRKLKKLGLTQSFEVGYEISPRGRAYLERAAHVMIANLTDSPKKKSSPPPKKKSKSKAKAKSKSKSKSKSKTRGAKSKRTKSGR